MVIFACRDSATSGEVIQAALLGGVVGLIMFAVAAPLIILIVNKLFPK